MVVSLIFYWNSFEKLTLSTYVSGFSLIMCVYEEGVGCDLTWHYANLHCCGDTFSFQNYCVLKINVTLTALNARWNIWQWKDIFIVVALWSNFSLNWVSGCELLKEKKNARMTVSLSSSIIEFRHCNVSCDYFSWIWISISLIRLQWICHWRAIKILLVTVLCVKITLMKTC